LEYPEVPIARANCKLLIRLDLAIAARRQVNLQFGWIHTGALTQQVIEFVRQEDSEGRPSSIAVAVFHSGFMARSLSPRQTLRSIQAA
jgi:hypothetical protein